MIGAMVLGSEVLSPLATFSFGVILAALVFHLFLSVVYAIVIVAFVQRMSLPGAIAIGAVAGLVLCFVNFYLFTGWFEWMIAARGWVNIFAHVSFGIAAGWAYTGSLRIWEKKHSEQESFLEERRRKQREKKQAEKIKKENKEPFVEDPRTRSRIREER